MAGALLASPWKIPTLCTYVLAVLARRFFRAQSSHILCAAGCNCIRVISATGAAGADCEVAQGKTAAEP
ncbi:unnamed protein product, partial [Symbiodinium microadriaticum]